MKVVTKHKKLLSWMNRERSATYSKNKKNVYRSILTPKRNSKFFSLNSSYTHKKMQLSHKRMLLTLTKRLGLARRFNDRAESLNFGHVLAITDATAAQVTDTETLPASDIKWRRLVNLKNIVKAFIPNCAGPAVAFGDSTDGLVIQGLLGLFKDVLLKSSSFYNRRAHVQKVTDSSNRLLRQGSSNRQTQQTQVFHNSQAETDNITEHNVSQTENVHTHSASQTENFVDLSASQIDNSGDFNTTQRYNFDDLNSSQRDDDPSAFQIDHSNVQSLQDLNEANSSRDLSNIGTLNSLNFNESRASSAETETFHSQRETSVSPLLVSLTEPRLAQNPATTSVSQSGTVSGQSSNASIYEQLGIVTEKPRRPQYALKCQRLGTFESWPQHHFMKPEELATAGLFYTGRVDCVRCFFCGGGLRDWELGDDIWVEHARWFPKCAYLKQHVSQTFVETVQELKTKDRISLEEVISKLKEKAALRKDFNIPEIKNSALETQQESANYLEVVNRTTHGTHNQQTTGATSDILMNKLKQEEKRPDLVKCGECGSSGSANESEVISRLQEKNNHLRQQLLCKICMGNDVEVVFLPCGHLVSCAECASAMKDCPVCRKFVRGTVRVFLC